MFQVETMGSCFRPKHLIRRYVRSAECNHAMYSKSMGTGSVTACHAATASPLSRSATAILNAFTMRATSEARGGYSNYLGEKEIFESHTEGAMGAS